MLPKGKRRHSVRALYRATRGVEPPAPPDIPSIELPAPPSPTPRVLSPAEQVVSAPGEITLTVPPEARGMRLDQYLAQAIPELSRSRVQLLIDQGKVFLAETPARGRHKVSPGEQIRLVGRPQPTPLPAEPEAIPLHIVFEDQYLAVVDKPAGMAVHAGAAAPEEAEADPTHTAVSPNDPDSIHTDSTPTDSTQTDSTHADPDALDDSSAAPPAARDPRSRGTLVNALLHHFGAGTLSHTGGDLRPGIVHRLDKQTSGLIVVAKDDLTHRRLGELFSAREVHKTYLALVHGHLAPARRSRDGSPEPAVTVALPIGRDLVRRTRMTTRRPPDAPGVRSAVSHVQVVDRLTTPFGPFTLVRVTIETGRTHQIRVHLQALGHPVVGDTLYGAPRVLTTATPEAGRRPARSGPAPTVPAAPTLALPRNFLHAAELRFTHPRTAEPLALTSPLPPELESFLHSLAAGLGSAPAVKSGV